MFQFTHPGRGATADHFDEHETYDVSIHAPREGCDEYAGHKINILDSFNSRTPGGVRPRYIMMVCSTLSFNSRTPGGVRLFGLNKPNTNLKFQFTHPGRGATLVNPFRLLAYQVSIHAPREGCDAIKVR